MDTRMLKAHDKDACNKKIIQTHCRKLENSHSILILIITSVEKMNQKNTWAHKKPSSQKKRVLK